MCNVSFCVCMADIDRGGILNSRPLRQGVWVCGVCVCGCHSHGDGIKFGLCLTAMCMCISLVTSMEDCNLQTKIFRE